MQTGVQSDGGSAVAQTGGELDLGALGRALWARKGRIVGLTLLAAALAFIAVNLVTPKYRSEARVLIETRENIFLRPDAEKNAMERGTTVDQEAVTSQVQLILSRDLARQVIKKLKLNTLPEFDPVLRESSMLRGLAVLFGFIKDPMSMTPEERVLKSYYERLSAFQVEKSRVIAIEFESEDAELAARAANTIAEEYIVLQQAAKQDQTRNASTWLAGEIETLRKKVAEAEAKVEKYRASTNLFIGTNNTSLSNQQLGEYNAQLGAARAQKSDAEAKARLIREALKSGGSIEFSDIVNSELMRRLSEQRVTLRAQLAEQSSTLLDRHPRIMELRAQIVDLERQMRGEADRLARSLENDAKFASAKVDGLSSGFDQLKRQAASTNEQDVQLRALEREAKSQRDLLESYLAKYREASARDSIGAAAPDARMISTAVVSNTPAWPRKVPIILVSALAMFALSSGFVLSSELLGALPARSGYVPVRAPRTFAPAPAVTANRDEAVVSHEPVPEAVAPLPRLPLQTQTGVPAAVPSPVQDPTPPAVLAPVPPPIAQAPRAAPAPVDPIEMLAGDLGAAGESARRITVVGASHNAGATMTAIALARSLAKQGRVVLVDLALGAPSLSSIASDPSAPGIAELVNGTASFGQIITRDRHSRAHLIMAGQSEADARALMLSQRLAITLEALGRTYDHVVIDAGVVTEAVLDRLAILAQRVVLVAAQADDPATVSAEQRLLDAGFAKVTLLVGGTGPQSAGDQAAA
jgi:succinoglycan biosynthesis transport protein ExoP